MSQINPLTGDEATWRDFAACLGTDTDAFYVDKGGDSGPAKRVCAQCPARLACLDYALEHEPLHGIFGGLTARERYLLKRRQLRRAA